jgi:AcrR family transcriptional regulator
MALASAPPQGGKARRTYDALVAATRRVIASTGTFSAETVGERAGMSQATFYSYFPTKDDALAAAFDLVLTDLDAAGAHALDVERLLDTDLRTVLSEAVAAVLDVFRDNALVFRLALVRLPEAKAIRDVFRRRERDGYQILRRFVELGQKAGAIRRSNTDRLTTTLLVTLQGLNNPILLRRRKDQPALDDIVSMLVGLLGEERNGSA